MPVADAWSHSKSRRLRRLGHGVAVRARIPTRWPRGPGRGAHRAVSRLGYLLEASGRVARRGGFATGSSACGRPRSSAASRSRASCLWLPLYGMSLMAESARIIDPNGRIARQWELGLSVLASRLRAPRDWRDPSRRANPRLPPPAQHPLARPACACAAVCTPRPATASGTRVVALRLPYYFWLGLRGFVGAFLWLIVPLLLLAQGHRVPALGILGGVLLAIVVLYVPFLQVRFARDNRLRAFREVRQVRAEFRGAPLAFAFALVGPPAVRDAALPAEDRGDPARPRVPRRAGLPGVHLPGPPARGWAVRRGARRDRRGTGSAAGPAGS